MNATHFFAIGFCLLIGIAGYWLLRHNLKWPTKNNPLFFLLIFSPSFIIVLSPLANDMLAHAVYAFSGGLFLADSVYQRHQDKKLLQQDNLKRKQNALKQKTKKKPPTKNAP